MTKKYYYPISSTSLAAIFGQACILPSSLYKNRLNDIQSKYENFILLTEKFGNSCTDCCVELVLTNEEVETLVNVKGGFYLFEKAIPISRIKKIFFAKKEQATRTISAINLSTAFIPDFLVSSNDNQFENTNLNEIIVPGQLVDSMPIVKSAYERYDRILGALSLMKVAHQKGCNVSPTYIDTLTKFNSLIESQKNAIRNVDKKYHKFIDNPHSLIIQPIDNTTLEEQARKDKQTIVKNKITKVIDPSNLNGLVYICYVLNNYGVGEESRRGKIDELILNNFLGLKSGMEESCAFYFGYNRGYSVFNNEYRGENKTEVVKFQLNSALDYYTIESVFEYAFNKNIPSSIQFIDSWWPSNDSKKAKRGEYLILNTIIRDKKKIKIFSEEWWTNCLSFFLPKDNLTFLGQDMSSVIILKILQPFANLIKDEIAEEYQETIDSINNSNRREIEKLENSLEEYKQQVQLLKNEMSHELSSNGHSTLKPDTVIPAQEIQQISEGTDTSIEAIGSGTGMLDADHIIDLCLMKKEDLKNCAKNLGCKIMTNDKTRDLVKKILDAEKNNGEIVFK